MAGITQSFAPGGGQQQSQSAVQPTTLAQLAAAYGGPIAAPAVQKSQYLAAALEHMQNQAPTIRTGGALASNLMAEALLQWSRSKNDQELLADYRNGAQAVQSSAVLGTGLPGDTLTTSAGANPSGGVPGGAGAVQASGPTAEANPTGTPSVTPIGGASSLTAAGGGQSAPMVAGPSVAPGTDPGHLALAQSLQIASAGAQGGAALPRGLRDNNPLNISATQPWQGMVGNDGQYAKFDTPADGWRAADINLANYGKLHGINTLEGVAQRWAPAGDGNNNPDAYAASVAQGLGIKPTDQINLADPNMRHAILSGMSKVETGEPLQFGQNFSQSTAPGSNQSTASASQSPPTPRPVQLGNGPDPSIPDPGALGPTGASPRQVMPSPGSVAALTPPQGGAAPSGPPTGAPATAQERAIYEAGMRSPAGSPAWLQAVEIAKQVQARVRTPLDPPKDYYWGPDGKPVSELPYSDVPGAPNAYTQRGPDNQIHVTNNPAFGAVPAGTSLGAGGVTAYAGSQPRQLVSPQERAAAGIQPADRNGYAMGPDGKVIKTADDPFGPSAQLDYSTKVMGMQPYQNYVGARQNLIAMQQLMQQTGGPSDLALLENGGKTINPNIAIRPNMLEAMYGSLSLPDRVTGEIAGVINHGGRLSPESRQAIYNAAQANVQSHWDALQPILGKVDYDAKRFGVTRQDLLPDLQPMPAAAGPGYGQPQTGGGPQLTAQQQALVQQAHDAVARGGKDPNAVRARLLSMGVPQGAF